MRLPLMAILACSATCLLPACQKVQGTGRTQLILTSAEQENKLGAQSYRQIVGKERQSADVEAIALVERVGRRLAAAAPERGFKYEFSVLESKQANAFCLPGGKVAVYTGLLSYCEHEAGLAAVMGHEIAHAIARHGGERMTQGLIVEGLSTTLDAAMQAKGVEPTSANVAMTAFGAGAQVGVLLPYSRKHETEADYLGLLYMAKAGYDPREAVGFWERFSKQGSGLPAFLSTHPHSADRANALQQKLGEALALYERSPKYGAGEAVPARYRK